MDAVFQEEKDNLKKLEQRIQDEIELHKSKSKEYVTELNEYEPGGGLGPSKADLRALYKKEDLLAKKYSSYVDEPYFGRMDLDNEGNDKTETFYIGKEGISINNAQVVIDWRAPVGEYFYMKTERKFKVNNYDYVLALRRALDVKKGQLVNYTTEFDSTNVSLEGEVIDPFLLTVLRDKRRQNRLTDIIKTIQNNQNDIIRRPRDEEFIVQGCAGSGKTMILLHRLSYLKFNNRGLNWNNVKIITPNKAFNAHINDLSSQLELDEIERLSVDEYYAYLIKAYSKNINVSSSVESEKLLSEDLLKEVYSLSFAEEVQKIYNNQWEACISQLEELNFGGLLSKYTIDSIDMSAHSRAAYVSLASTVKSLVAAVKDITEKNDSLKKHIEWLNEAIEENESAIINLWDRIEKHTIIVRKECEDELNRVTNLLNSPNDYSERKQKELEDIKEKHKELKREVDSSKRSIDLANRDRSAYLSYDSLVKMADRGDVLAKQMLAQNYDGVTEIGKLEDEYSNTPIYKFIIRNQQRDIIDRKKKLLEGKMALAFVELSKTMSANLVNAEMKLSELAMVRASIEDEIRSNEKRVRALQLQREALQKCIDLIITQKYPDLRKELSAEQLELVQSRFEVYFNALDEYVSGLKKKSSLRDSLSRDTDELAVVEKKLPTEADSENIRGIEKVLDLLSINALMNSSAITLLRSLYLKYEEKYTGNNYRHKLYIKLLFCYLYFAKCPVFDSLINIDEAQDLSPSEYILLKNVLGKDAVFNLYGDINQLVYSYKGIRDWDELKGVIRENIYVLNENYRNTLQITDYCNKEFESEVYPIGISGSPVEEFGLQEALAWLQELKTKNPEYRCAIIYRYGRKGITDAIRQIVQTNDTAWNSVDDKKISVVSVEMAKGLEFDAVVAITDAMSVNEKYIAFTRALNDLAIVKDTFSNELEKIDEEEDTSETEFTDEDLDIEGASDVKPVSDILPKSNEEPLPKNPEISNEPLEGTSVIGILSEVFEEEVDLNANQEAIVENLENQIHVACNAPSGNMKSLLFFAEVKRRRIGGGNQSIITAAELLQENELLMAERMGLKVGRIGRDFNEFANDVKRDKYDLIFVPFEFFEKKDNASALSRYFEKRLELWAIDHISSRPDLWVTIKDCGQSIGTTFYLMSKEGFGGVDIDGFKVIDFIGEEKTIRTENILVESTEKKDEWISQNISQIAGPGIIYCDEADTCRRLSKILRKCKIKAPEYTDTNNVELMHYLTNGFIAGSIPILITTQDLGRNLSNYKLHFVVHYDIPDKELYLSHIEQLNTITEQPVCFNLTLIEETPDTKMYSQECVEVDNVTFEGEIEDSADVRDKLFDYLRQLRLSIAKEGKMPPYIVFSDKTLKEICFRLPQSREDMLSISGIGDTKFKQYGETFITAIAEFLENNGINRQSLIDDTVEAQSPAAQKRRLGKGFKAPFYINEEDALKFVYKDYYCINDIRNELNRITTASEIKKVMFKDIWEYLVSKGYVAELNIEGKMIKVQTDLGREKGIMTVKRTMDNGFSYTLLQYPKEIQHEIVEHFCIH